MTYLSKTVNTQTIQVMSQLGQPITGLQNIIIASSDNFSEVINSERELYKIPPLGSVYPDDFVNNPYFYKPLYIQEEGGLKLLTSLSNPKRNDALDAKEVDGTYTYVLYTPQILSKGFEEEGRGVYKVAYDFVDQTVKRVKVFIEDIETHELFEETEMSDTVLIDYDNLLAVEQKINKFQFRTNDKKLYYFESEKEVYELSTKKVASIPNSISESGIRGESFLNLNLQQDNELIKQQQNYLNKRNAYKSVDDMLEDISLLLNESMLDAAEVSSIEQWEFNGDLVGIEDPITKQILPEVFLVNQGFLEGNIDSLNLTTNDVYISTSKYNTLSVITILEVVPKTDIINSNINFLEVGQNVTGYQSGARGKIINVIKVNDLKYRIELEDTLGEFIYENLVISDYNIKVQVNNVSFRSQQISGDVQIHKVPVMLTFEKIINFEMIPKSEEMVTSFINDKNIEIYFYESNSDEYILLPDYRDPNQVYPPTRDEALIKYRDEIRNGSFVMLTTKYFGKLFTKVNNGKIKVKETNNLNGLEGKYFHFVRISSKLEKAYELLKQLPTTGYSSLLNTNSVGITLSSVNKSMTLNKKRISDLDNQFFSSLRNTSNEINVLTNSINIDVLNSYLRLEVDWVDPVPINNEEIIEYNVKYFICDETESLTIDNLIGNFNNNKFGYINNDNNLDQIIKSALNNIKKTGVITIKTKFMDLNPIVGKIQSSSSGNKIIKTSTPMFLDLDSRTDEVGKVIQIGNSVYDIARVISSSEVELVNPVQEIVNLKDIQIIKRNKIPVYTSTKTNESKIELDVNLNDAVIIAIQPVTEYKISGRWVLQKFVIKDTKYKDSNKPIMDFIEQDLGLRITYSTPVTKPLPPLLETANFRSFDLSNKELDKNIRNKLKQIIDLTKKIDAVKAKSLDVQRELLVSPTIKSIDYSKKSIDYSKAISSYNKILFGSNNDGGTYTSETGTSQDSLLGLYNQMEKIKEDFLKNDFFSHDYRIGITFTQPDNGVNVIKYVLVYKVKEKGDGKRINVSVIDPGDFNKTIDFAEMRVESPERKKLYQDPITQINYYETDEGIRKFSLSLKPGVEYTFKVASISEFGVISDWSNEVVYKIEVESDLIDTDIFINDQITRATSEKALLPYLRDIQNIQTQTQRQIEILEPYVNNISEIDTLKNQINTMQQQINILIGGGS